MNKNAYSDELILYNEFSVESLKNGFKLWFQKDAMMLSRGYSGLNRVNEGWKQ